MSKTPTRYNITFVHVVNGKEVTKEEAIKYIAEKFGKKGKQSSTKTA